MIRSIWALVDRRSRRVFWLLVLAVVVSSIWNLGGIASIMPFMQVVADPDSLSEIPYATRLMDTLSMSDTTRFLILAGSVVLFLFVTGNIFLAGVTWATIAFARRVSYHLSTRLFSVYINQPYPFFLSRNSSELIKNLFGETGTVSGTIVQPAMQLLADGILSLAIVGLLIVADPQAAVIVALVLGGGYGAVFLALRAILTRSSRRKVTYNKQRFGIASEALGAIKQVKLQSLESLYSARVAKAAIRLERAKARVKTSTRIPRYLLEILAFGGLLAVALVSFAGPEESSDILPLLSVYALAGYRLLPSMQKVFASVASIRGSQASIELIHNEFRLKHSAETPVEQPRPMPFDHAIELRNITFSYENSDRPAVRDIDLIVPKNQTIGIAGPTGCGKTTLVDIILGLLWPQFGELRCDETPVGADNVRNWMANFGYVPQSVYISDTTIAENIAFGVTDDQVDQERIQFAARLASLDEYVGSLPEGFDTRIGERGVKMSGGQLQRVGIARALYHDPPILVFDEATSALDNATEKVVMDAINRLSHQKTIVMIAHRLSTLEVADRIILMDHGCIVDTGTYHDLQSRHTRFRSTSEGDDREA